MEIQDRRVRRTQHLLAKALIALTLEKGYEAVTIRDITERADVGYTTFFRHYRDKDDLLKDVMHVVLTELVNLLCSHSPAMDATTIGVLLFRYVQEHNEVVRVLLDSHTLRHHLLEAATQTAMHENTARPDSPIPFEIAAYHVVSSSIALIEWWLDHQMPYPIEKMGIIYAELIAHPIGIVAFSPK